MLAVNNNGDDVSWVTSYPPYVIMELAALLFWQSEERKSGAKLGRVLSLGNVIFSALFTHPKHTTKLYYCQLYLYSSKK
jgi:hypothetical protein